MKSDAARKPGFYWVRFEGEIIVAEYSDGAACESDEEIVPHWHVPGSASCYADSEVCELIEPAIRNADFARVGGYSRAQALTPERRQQIARAAIQKHWDALTPEQRSAQARKGANTRKRNAAARARAAKKGKR